MKANKIIGKLSRLLAGPIITAVFILMPGILKAGEDNKDIPDPVLKDSTYALYQSGDFYLAGQPMQDDLEELAKDGVTLVINVRTEAEMKTFAKEYFDEEVVVKGLNIEYVQAGIGGADGYSPEVISLISEKIAATDGKVLIHCAAAGRATTVWMAWLVNSGQCSIDEAMRLGKQARFVFPFESLLGFPVTVKKTKK
ncbi:MAG TPA: dual specificity protein phosphatase family protein [Cyclobacteriaceae bacterium]|nr:dual specificity protein phosphatase family protein [Cyclobacteriaceae bacterium]